MTRRILRIALCLCMWLTFLGPGLVHAQTIQGYDDASQQQDPDTWTQAIYDTDEEGTTVTFELNPCEWVLYQDENGRPLSCLPREVDCDTLDLMETKLENALDVWDQLAPSALTFVVNQPAACEQGCATPDADHWEDDGDWIATRTYLPTTAQFTETNCPNADTFPQPVGAGLRLYEDPTSDSTTRWVRECDIVFFGDRWDGIDDTCDPNVYSLAECAGAWQMAMAHEAGHCLGIGHSYLTRRTLGPLVDDLASEITLVPGLPSIMSYDRVGTVDVFNQEELNPYDKAVYLSTFSTGPPVATYFTAYGTVRDGDCATGNLLYGVGVFALEKTGSNWHSVQMSISGVDPLGDGEFRLEHLDRSKDYRLLVADLRDINQTRTNGWDFDETAKITPGLNAVETDAWSETNSGGAYKYEMSAQYATGFDYELFAEFTEPSNPDDYDAGCLEITFPE